MVLFPFVFTQGVVISPSLPIPTSLFGCPEQDVEDPTTPDKSATTPSQRGCVKKAVPDEGLSLKSRSQ